MQPTPEIVAAAREFHTLGGTKGIENPYMLGRWIVHPFFSKDNVAFLIGYIDQGDDEAGDDYWAKSNKAIPILTESELWAWLNKHTNTEPNLHIDKETGYTMLTVLDIIGDDGYNVIGGETLHSALYAACLWVAKEKHG